MRITLIAAITRNRGLGASGDMLHHISGDLRRFKALTTGHPVIMGRKTFESFPKGPLPGRRNMVVTRDPAYSREGAETFHSLEAALAAAGTDEVYVIGGGEIYAQAMPLATGLRITEIDSPGTGADTFFPEIDPGRWHLASLGEWQRDDRSGLRYRYADYTPISHA